MDWIHKFLAQVGKWLSDRKTWIWIRENLHINCAKLNAWLSALFFSITLVLSISYHIGIMENIYAYILDESNFVTEEIWQQESDGNYIVFQGDSLKQHRDVYRRARFDVILSIVFLIIAVFFGVNGLLACFERRKRQKQEIKDNEDLYMEFRKYAKTSSNYMLSIFDQIEKQETGTLASAGWKLPDNQDRIYGFVGKQFAILCANYSTWYKSFCDIIGKQVQEHIRRRPQNKDDAVNVSIKVIIPIKNSKRLVTLGRYIDIPSSSELNLISSDDSEGIWRVKDGEWLEKLSKTYSVDEDSVICKLSNYKYKSEVFYCGNLKAYKEKHDNPNEEQYRRPQSVKRDFNATIVCRISGKKTEQDHHYTVLGFICLDTTNTYEEWDTSKSFEENCICFAAKMIFPVLLHTYNEIQQIVELLNEYNPEKENKND